MPTVGRTHGWLWGACAGICAAVLAALPAMAADKQASFVVDGNSGKVLHDQQGDEARYPASLTKMMTLYMAFERIEAGDMSNDTMLTVSVTCAAMAPSKIGLEVGERISLGNAVKAVITKSANDMACAIAEAVSGSESVFALRMTKRAREIGMTRTTFRNASGLPDPGQITTARDMVTLGLRLRDDFPKHFAQFQLRSFSYGGKTYRSHNTLMNGFVGMDGIKTGYTRASGFNLVSSVQRDGKYVVGAVFGGVTASVRNAHMRMILFKALGEATSEKTRKAGPMLIARAAPAAKPAKKPPAVAVAAVEKAAAKPAANTPAAKPAALAAAKAAPTQRAQAKEQALATAMTPAPAAAAPSATPEQAAAEPGIKIAKVRAVMVAGQAAGAQPAAAPTKPVAVAEKSDAAKPRFTTASAAPRLGFGGAQGTAPAAAQPTDPAAADSVAGLIAKAPARAPGSFNSQVAALSAPPQQDLALRPSTAADASEGADQASPAAGKTYRIQVGAFASEAEAQRHLEAVRGRASSLLKNRRGLAEVATVGKKQVYRARFAEFDNASATAACSTLRQQKVDCMVLKGP